MGGALSGPGGGEEGGGAPGRVGGWKESKDHEEMVWGLFQHNGQET